MSGELGPQVVGHGHHLPPQRPQVPQAEQRIAQGDLRVREKRELGIHAQGRDTSFFPIHS